MDECAFTRSLMKNGKCFHEHLLKEISLYRHLEFAQMYAHVFMSCFFSLLDIESITFKDNFTFAVLYCPPLILLL